MPRIALAAALAGLLVIGAIAIFARPAIGPGDQTAPPSAPPSTATSAPTTSTPSPASTATPTTAPAGLVLSPSDVGRTLAAGAYNVPGFAAPFSITLPPGWKVSGFTENSISIESADDGHINLALLVVDKVYTDPCHRETGPTAIGPAVDSLVDAFSSMPGFDVTDVKFVLVGGAAARSFTISNSINAAAANCSGDALALGTTNEDGDDVDITMFGGESDVFRVVNAGGTRVLVAVTNTPQIVEGVQPLVDRLLFDNRTCLIERCLNE